MKNRVRIVNEFSAPRTVRGKFAGGLPRPEHQDREGTWVGFAPGSLDGCLVLLDGEREPTYFLGTHVVRLDD